MNQLIRKGLRAGLAAMMLAAFAVPVAVADNVSNDVGAQITSVDGKSVTVSYQIKANGSDGCNVGTASDLKKATLTPAVPLGVTANPAYVVIGACGVLSAGITFSWTAPGTYTIKVPGGDGVTGSVVNSDGADGSYTEANSSFTITVKAPTSTSVSLAPSTVLIGHGSVTTATVTDTTANLTKSNPTGTVSFSSSVTTDTFSAASCALAPVANTSDKSSCSVTVTPSAGPGSTITGAFVDGTVFVGSTGSAALTVVTDATAPTAAPTLDPAANTAGWNNSSTTISWHWSDNAGGTGIDSSNCTTSTTASASGTYDASCKDLAANTGQASKAVQIDTTPPTIVADTHGYTPGTWTNQTVNVSFSCVDEMGGSGSTSALTGGSVSNDTATGSVTSSGTCSDAAGNAADPGSVTVSGIKVDKIPPTIVADTHGYTPGTWTNQTVSVSFSCVDETGGSGSTSALTGGSVSNDTATGSVTSSGTCSDAAGNTADPGSVTVPGIKVDKSAPNAPTAHLSPTPNGAGWNNTPVTVSFTDNGDNGPSGVASCTSSVARNSETPFAGITISGTCTDNAGNPSSATPATVRIDLNGPNVTLDNLAGVYTVGSTPSPAPGCSTTDLLSGVQTKASLSGFSTGAVGSFTANCTGGLDVADNQQGAVSGGFQVTYAICGYTQGLPKKSGSTLPVKLQICNASGANLSSSAITVTSLSVAPQLIGMSPDGTVEDAGTANPDYNFRFDQTLFGGAGGYIYNLQLKDRSTGLNLAVGTYQLKFKAGADPISHSVAFAVGK